MQGTVIRIYLLLSIGKRLICDTEDFDNYLVTYDLSGLYEN
jgi:hypothetical protein